MYRRLSAIMFPLVSILLIGAVYWGYQEHQEKNSVLIKAENSYQRSFHDLAFHMDKLHEQLGNTLAVNSTSTGYHRKGLVNIWRLTSQAQSEVSQLPLTYLPFTEAENLLSHIANFAYKTAVRDLTKHPLSAEEFETLKSLYDESAEISADLHKMQQDVLASRLRWMDVELAIAADGEEGANIIVDGLRSVDRKVGEYPELNWGPSVESMYRKRTMKLLSGEMTSAEEVKQKAAQFLKADAADVTVVENAKGTEYASYSATAYDNDPQRKAQMDFTARGGQLAWYMKTRPVGDVKIDFERARLAADQFLSEHEYKGMRAVNYDEYQNTGTFTYVGTQNNVLIYPEKVTVKIALDNGEPIGLQGGDYVYEHHQRELPSPIMSEAEALATINSELDIRHKQLALIENDLGEEVLCYEFTGQLNGAVYRVYINAESGIEEAVETLPANKGAVAMNKEKNSK